MYKNDEKNDIPFNFWWKCEVNRLNKLKENISKIKSFDTPEINEINRRIMKFKLNSEITYYEAKKEVKRHFNKNDRKMILLKSEVAN